MTTTYQRCSSDQQDLNSTHSHSTQFSSSPLEPNLGHNCRTLLNHFLCQSSSPVIHSREQSGGHVNWRECKLGKLAWDTTQNSNTLYWRTENCFAKHWF